MGTKDLRPEVRGRVVSAVSEDAYLRGWVVSSSTLEDWLSGARGKALADDIGVTYEVFSRRVDHLSFKRLLVNIAQAVEDLRQRE